MAILYCSLHSCVRLSCDPMDYSLPASSSVVQTDFPCEASVAWKLWKKLRLEWLWGPS